MPYSMTCNKWVRFIIIIDKFLLRIPVSPLKRSYLYHIIKCYFRVAKKLRLKNKRYGLFVCFATETVGEYVPERLKIACVETAWSKVVKRFVEYYLRSH